jgi:hypothetical protein
MNTLNKIQSLTVVALLLAAVGCNCNCNKQNNQPATRTASNVPPANVGIPTDIGVDSKSNDGAY